ncbi:MAG: hypothetical protein ABR577_05395 [Pyrinomonadaceae bacterium]
MRKIGRCFLSFLPVVLFLGSTVKAQGVYGKTAKLDGLREIEISKALQQMPETGRGPEDFVAPHWMILNRAEGDLNADGIKDFAFILTLDEEDTKYIESLKKLDEDDGWIYQTFIIVVIDSRGDRKLHLSAINYQLFGNSNATVSGDERGEFKVSFKKNVLDVIVNYGGSQRTDATFHFREDPPTGGFLTLIGFDVESYCVTLTESCGKSKMSENYLTSTRVVTDYKIQGDKLVGTDKRTQIPPVKIDFMDASLNESNHKDFMRPF